MFASPLPNAESGPDAHDRTLSRSGAEGSELGISPNERSAGTEWLQARVEQEGLQRYIATVRERFGLILACTVLTSVAAFGYLAVASNVYQAEADLLITPVSGQSPTYVGLGLITSTNDPTRDVLTASKLVTTPAVARLVIAQLSLSDSPAQLVRKVRASPVTQSNIIAVTVRARSPQEAQSLANAFAEQTVVSRTEVLHRQIDALLPELQRQVAGTAPEQRGPGSLNERALSLQGLRAGSDPTLQVIAPAELPERPVEPRPKLTIAAGVVAGMVLGVSAAFCFQALDERLRREEQLRAILRLPVLGRIPLLKGLHRARPIAPAQVSGPGREAFRSLRSSLISSSFGDGQTSRVIFIAGSTPSEGKTTTAINLAASLAELGTKVIVIEADVRRPSVGPALGIAALHGTADVLLGTIPLTDALVPYGPEVETLQLLLAGAPSMLLADRLVPAMARKLISEARTLAQYVIIDAPPLTEVIDGLPFAALADDIVLVVRLGKSALGRISDLGELLIRNSLQPVGTVIIGSEAPVSYYAGAAELPSLSGRRGSEIVGS